jgi:hypothetical protein
MDTIEQNLMNWRASLLPCLPIGGLLARNPIAYRWKAPFRCWLVRESAFWRIADLLTQSYALHQQGYTLGARILLRSSFETLAILIYLNQLIQQVIDGDLNFHAFSETTSILALGSRDKSTDLTSLNIVTIIQKCNKRYPGIETLYGSLSESAHPNYEGMVVGYSVVDHDACETHFSNRWIQLYGGSHPAATELCMTTFRLEYNEVWVDLMSKLESWIIENNEELEATRNVSLKN